MFSIYNKELSVKDKIVQRGFIADMNVFESYWDSFLENDKYNGKAFEDLIEELLTLMYGQKWKRTSDTHDGNRDFYLNLNDETFWAECKSYQQVISLKTLAPTLVMAQVCNANTILFFSRSKINRFAKEKITAYGHRTSKKVLFYDGELLEKLIIAYNDRLSEKYQLVVNSITDEKSSENLLKVSELFFPSILSKMITSDDDYVDYKTVKSVHYNETFSLLITVLNNSINNSIIELSFAENNIDRFYYEYLSKDISYDSKFICKMSLEPGESTAFSLNLRVPRFKNELFLPNFHIKYVNNEKQTCEWFSKPLKVECKWVGKTKLLGSHYYNILKKIEDTLTNNKEFSVLLLTGSSGTGKTRILTESCCPLLKQGYRILELNVTKEHSTINLIKEIIYFLYEVPAELIVQVITERIIECPDGNLNIDKNIIIRIVNMIDSLEQNLDIFMKQYKDLLFHELSKRKIAIIIDNMQFASLQFQQFWRCYVDFSVNQCHTNKTIFLICVNLDYMSEECAKTIYILQNSNIKHLVNEYVDGFKDTNQGILFLRELMHIKDSDYDEVFKEMIDAVSLNPFNLYQMVNFLEENEVIKHSKDKQGYLLTTEATLKTAFVIPKDINDVLKRRFDYISTHLNETALNLIFSACYLFEHLDEEIITLFDINLGDLDYLVKHQILVHTEDGYHFIHDIIRKYYEKNWAKNHLYCLKKIKAIEKIRYYGEIYKIYKLCILKEKTYIIKVCKNQDITDIPVRLQKVFLENLFEQCLRNDDIKLDIRLWLGSLAWICNNVRNVMGSIKALQYHKKIYSYLENEFESFSCICSNELRRLLHSHCDIYIQIHDRKSSIEFANRVINKLSIEPNYNNDIDEYYVLKAIMYNRIFCSYNNAFPTDEIKSARNEAIKNSRLLIPYIQDESKRTLIAYLNDSDEGYCFYGFTSEYPKLINIWKKCLIDIPTLAPEKTMNYYRKRVQFYLMKQDSAAVKKHIAEGRSYLHNGKYSHEPLIFNTFFTMSEIINNLQHCPKEMYLYTENLIDKLTKIQLLLKSNKLADIYLLKGINAFYSNNIETVYYALKKCISVIQ